MSVPPGAAPVEILRRKVGVIPLVGLIFFSVSGGPYGLEPAVAWSGAGLTLILILAIPLVFSVPSALMSAELGAAIPVSGGYFYWVKAGLGRGFGYLEGMLSWLLSFLDLTIYPVLFVLYLDHLLTLALGSEHSLHDHVFWSTADGRISFDTGWLVAVAFTALLGLLTMRGAKVVGDTSVVLFVLLIAPLVVLTGIGVWRAAHGDLAGMELVARDEDGAPMSIVQAVGSGLAVVVWNYIGWDQVSTVSQDIERPQRTYPRALLISVPLITLVYLGPIVAMLAAKPDLEAIGNEEYDLVNAAQTLGGPLLMVLVGLSALLSQVGLFSSLLLSSAQLPQVIARDGFAPRSLTRLSPRYGTPVRSLVVLCVVIAVFSAMDFQTVINSDITLSLAALLLEFVALITLRVRFPAMRRPFSVPGGVAGAVAITVPVVVILGWLLYAEYGDEVDGPGVTLGAWMVVAAAASWWVVRRYARPVADVDPIDASEVDFGPGTDAEAILEWGPSGRPPAGWQASDLPARLGGTR